MRGLGIAIVAGLIACGPRAAHHNPDGADDAGIADAAAPPSDGLMISCAPDAGDQQGCACTPSGGPRACYSGDPSARHVGVCKDGMQDCPGTGEFSTYGPCTGEVMPGTESCTNGLDDNCDGTVDCADPTCATDPACHTGCTDGDTRPCYDGPSGTLGVGTCKAGMQVCANGMWPTTCPGEVLPMPEDCTSPQDLNCNHLPGCFDIFACLGNPACTEHCALTGSECVCPDGQGDVATCPEGMVGHTNGAFPPTVECCPCTANDCTNAACCGEAVCAGNPACDGLVCDTLPPSCNGQVNFDCDDFPEDCDEPCCKCTSCQ
jgi:hypothetical protein